MQQGVQITIKSANLDLALLVDSDDDWALIEHVVARLRGRRPEAPVFVNDLEAPEPTPAPSAPEDSLDGRFVLSPHAAKTLKRQLIDAGVTQRAVAERAGITEARLSGILGQRAKTDGEQLDSIRRAINAGYPSAVL